jgi:hypothetical protein
MPLAAKKTNTNDKVRSNFYNEINMFWLLTRTS